MTDFQVASECRSGTEAGWKVISSLLCFLLLTLTHDARIFEEFARCGKRFSRSPEIMSL